MNQLFKSLYETVLVNTNRPTLVKETKEAIIAATKELHNRGKFLADIREVLLTSTNGGQTRYKFSIPQDKLVREIISVAPVSVNGLKGVKLKNRDIFFTGYCSNYYSWYNNTLTINIAHCANTFELMFLSFPDTSLEGYDSWIARKYSHYITDLATFRILVMTNQIQQAGVYKGLVGEARIPGTHIFNLLQENQEIS